MAGSTTDGAIFAEELLAIGTNRYAPWLDRRVCLEVLEHRGLPEPRSEAWQHTNVGRWYETALADSAPATGLLGVEHPTEVQVIDFADARAQALVEQHGGRAFELAAQPLAAVNGLLLGAGLAIRVPRATHPASAVRLADLGAAYQHILIVVEAGAVVELIEEPARYAHRIVEAVIQPGAVLNHRRLQAASAGRECSLVGVRVEAGARYELAQISRGAELRRNDILATLLGEGAEAVIQGAWRLDGRSHLDNQIAVDHAAPGGRSRQTYRGVAADRARAVLNGRIHIAPNAQRSDATLTSKSLLASPGAEVYAKPELEIYANDVKCSHGATVGAIDDEAVYYFRSRGIGEDAARALFVRGFLREAIDDVESAERLGVIA